jgi:ethanolamine permease
MSNQLKKTLSPLLLWSIGVGNVISGMYFGWNLGLEKGGTYGMAIATGIVIILYICFSFSYAELACAIPKAGGGFDYAKRAFGPKIGFITGLAQVFMFTFGPPAIAIGIGTNINLAFPNISIVGSAVIFYLIFTAINVFGVKIAATFELIITIIAILGLVLFAGITLPHFQIENLSKNASIGGFSGIFAAIPFAIWFFLGIEGLANVAEESENPQKDLSKGFSRALFTLVLLCLVTFIASIGLGGWEKVVYNEQHQLSDSPLPLALSLVMDRNNWLYQTMIWIGVMGLVASFHGLMLAGGRVTLEFGRYGYAPKFLGQVSPKYSTPQNALIFNSILGIFALFTGKTGEIITIAIFGALTLYTFSLASLLKLRNTEPNLPRPFKVQLYPIMPILGLFICVLCFLAITFQNQFLALLYFGFMVMGFLIFTLFYKK